MNQPKQYDFTFVTSNDAKLMAAKAICQQFGVTFDRETVDFIEMQHDDGEPIARHKSEQAFTALQKPVVVTDDSWIIPGLRGFPGPYMKQINHWLTSENFLDLTRGLTDRRIILRQIVVFQDEHGQQLFTSDVVASILTEARGSAPAMCLNVISFDGSERSAGELYDSNINPLNTTETSWHILCDWLHSR